VLNIIRVANEWQVLWPSYKEPGRLSGCYLDTVKYFVTMQLGWGRHGGRINGVLNVWKQKMCMIIILDGLEATDGIGYRERVHLYRGLGALD